MDTRRQFIINGLRGAGAWLLAPTVAARIVRLAAEQNLAYLVPVANPTHILYANKVSFGFILTLDVTSVEDVPKHFTWQKWLNRNGVDTDDAKAIYEAVIKFRLYTPAGNPLVTQATLDEPVLDELMESYLNEEFCTRDSAAAKASQYLAEFDLGPHVIQPNSSPLGNLKFVRWLCPGNYVSRCQTDDVKTLACLQQRLIALDVPTEIKVVG